MERIPDLVISSAPRFKRKLRVQLQAVIIGWIATESCWGEGGGGGGGGENSKLELELENFIFQGL